MFKVGDIVICAYSDGTDNLVTHNEYEVLETSRDSCGERIVVRGEERTGDYYASRFMVKTDMIKQVLENARND